MSFMAKRIVAVPCGTPLSLKAGFGTVFGLPLVHFLRPPQSKLKPNPAAEAWLAERASAMDAMEMIKRRKSGPLIMSQIFCTWV